MRFRIIEQPVSAVADGDGASRFGIRRCPDAHGGGHGEEHRVPTAFQLRAHFGGCTGAKELAAFAALGPERLFPRVLPTREGIAACEAAGIPHKNIIAMQGPFTYALNCALMEQFSIRYLVTKDGGAVGGFAEKAQAAQDTGAQLIVVRRPAENGQTAAQILARCKEVLA